MEVYGIHTGSIHEGVGVHTPLYLNKETAIFEAIKMVEVNQNQVKRIHGDNKNAIKNYSYKDTLTGNEDKFMPDIVFCWQSTIEEVIVYKYQIIE
jgi:hypothetical protein